ncbi:MAG TPA: hypothetical protein VFX30_11375 [bacterium]|nr:hypothetical protein [bacterium]
MPHIEINFEGRRRATLSRRRLLASFRRSVRSLRTDLLRGTAKPLHVARRAHRLYLLLSDGRAPRPSVHSFERKIYGKTADPEITALIPKPDRQTFVRAFEAALRELAAERPDASPSPRAVALRAHALHAAGRKTGDRKPSAEVFRKMASGSSARPEIVACLEAAGVRPSTRAPRGLEVPRSRRARGRLNKLLIFKAFEDAVAELAAANGAEKIKVRAVSARARDLYRSLREEDGSPPSPETFRKYASGPRALPEIVSLLNAAGIRPARRTKLNRDRLRFVFREAVQRFEASVFRGQARPVQIARRAYDLYARSDDAAGAPRPSTHTFQRLVYGKTADPEILGLIAAALKGRG